MRLNITIKCKGKRVFKIFCEDPGKPNSKYANRIVKVSGTRQIHFSLPITPNNLNICCYDAYDQRNLGFEVEVEDEPLTTYNIWIDSGTKDFLNLALFFSQVCGFEQGSKKGRIFQTSDEKYKIKYYPVIVDFKTGRDMNTSGRIGHSTGNIDAEKIRFDKYTVAMRMIILLHEYCHVYKNPRIGLEISNEVGADLNALYIYLGMGFSKVDAIFVYANIFLKAQTPGNMKRMNKLLDYIKRFEAQEFAKKL